MWAIGARLHQYGTPSLTESFGPKRSKSTMLPSQRIHQTGNPIHNLNRKPLIVLVSWEAKAVRDGGQGAYRDRTYATLPALEKVLRVLQGF